jgi:uroporphyrinogen decarboxylase
MAQRMATMTDRERVEALLRRKKPDRVPVWPFAYAGFATVYTGTTIADAYNKPEVSLAAQRKTAQDFGWVFSPMLGYAAYGGWELGGEIKWPSGEFAQAPTVSRFPVETADDVMNLKVPDVKTAGIVPLMKEFYDLSSRERLDNEPFNVISFGANSSFTIAGNISSPDKLCKWIIKKPAVAHRLLQLANEHIIKLAEYWKELYGVEGVLPLGGEPTSANQLISPNMFAEFVLPYIKEANEVFLDMGYKHLYAHICGEHNENMQYWAQIPMGDPGIVSIAQEVDLLKAAKYFPNDIILGNLEPAIIQVGTPDEVYEATKKNVEVGKTISGGYIFSPGCEMPPMAPVEAVKAMTQAVDDFGWYE